jgi:pilus assembly protein Flp/PilA
MLSMYVKFQNWMRRHQEGQGMVEYAMIVGLVSVGVLALLALMGGQVKSIFTSITGKLSEVGITAAP